MVIWTYWEGPISPVIKACLDRMQAYYGHQHQIVREWPQGLGPKPNCRVNYRANLWKWEMLYQHGGLVLDADCIIMKDVRELCDRSPLFFQDRGGMCDIAFMYAERLHPLINYYRRLAWLKYELKLFDRYTALGKHITVSSPPPRARTDDRLIQPIHWKENPIERFFFRDTDAGHAKRFDRAAYCYMLTRGLTGPDQQILDDSFMGWLLRQPVGCPQQPTTPSLEEIPCDATR